MDSTLDEFRVRIAAWVIDVSQAPTSAGTIPGLVHCRPVSSGWHITVADPNDETTAAIERLGASSNEQVDVTFEDAVLAYLSRSRVGHSFYTGTAS